MKNLLSILTLSILLAPTSSLAAPTEYFTAVLDSMPVQQMLWRNPQLELVGIKNTMTYRCPGCFGFEITLENGTETDDVVKFTTKMDLKTHTITVTR